MKKTGISTDCICDLPEDYLLANGIEVMHFYIHTSTGRFRDGDEITSGNILEYLENGGEVLSSNIPDPEEYKKFYEKMLKQYDEVIHIATSDKASLSFHNATESLSLLGEDSKRVTIIDSEHLSTGLGHMVLRAVALRDSGKSAAEIAEACAVMKTKISSTFIVPNADYLYRMGKVSKFVKNLSRALTLHPVLFLKDGKISVKSMRVGDYEKAVMRYVRSELKHGDKIDRKQLFITHAGCPPKIISQIKETADALCKFDEMTVTKASAAISSNCGPETVGVLFVYK